MRNTKLIYSHGEYYIVRLAGDSGYESYHDSKTGIARVARYKGEKALDRAKAEITRREQESQASQKITNALRCPHCWNKLTVEHLRGNVECSTAMASAVGIYRLSKRITPPKAGPGRPKALQPQRDGGEAKTPW